MPKFKPRPYYINCSQLQWQGNTYRLGDIADLPEGDAVTLALLQAGKIKTIDQALAPTPQAEDQGTGSSEEPVPSDSPAPKSRRKAKPAED